MSLRSIFKGAMLVTASAALIAVITIAGILALAFYYSDGGRSWSVSVTRVSDALTYDGTEYDFSGDALLGDDRWAILIGEDGRVIWSLRKPADVPEQYTLTDVASFTRWYLGDYPVQCRIRDDGLLVVGSPKGSMWKHDISMQSRLLHDAPLWIGGIFLLALGCVLLLAYFAVRRWFRQAQRVRDAARSDWIGGVSHDIRTPLSMVMGYAAQMEEAEDLLPERRKQAGIIRSQSQEIRDLVNDLNLTMRLDCAMQALRKEPLQVESFLRQTAADFLNGGMGEGFDFEMDLPAEPLPEIEADAFLLRRAVNNLLTNCVRHNTPGGSIRLGARAEGKSVVLFVKGGAAVSIFLSLQLSRQMFRPIGRLHDAISQVGQNDLQVQVAIEEDRRDELSELAQQFNRMVLSLRRNQQALLENQQALNDAQIRMLQAQLNPHFLCNTLDTMKWISKINQVPQVALMSTNLADILRFCISPDEFVPLEKELQILGRYVEIQRIRLSDSFTYEQTVPEALLSCMVPKMMLQPLAENAILHGLSGVPDGKLTVEARELEDETLEIRVCDNGAGLPEALLGPYRPPEKQTRHLGLFNVDTILKKHYGERFGLRLDNRTDGTGACITARLPVRRRDAE